MHRDIRRSKQENNGRIVNVVFSEVRKYINKQKQRKVWHVFVSYNNIFWKQQLCFPLYDFSCITSNDDDADDQAVKQDISKRTLLVSTLKNTLASCCYYFETYYFSSIIEIFYTRALYRAEHCHLGFIILNKGSFLYDYKCIMLPITRKIKIFLWKHNNDKLQLGHIYSHHYNSKQTQWTYLDSYILVKSEGMYCTRSFIAILTTARHRFIFGSLFI